MMTNKQVRARTEFQAVAIPRAGIALNEARDKWLAANPENRVLDDGGRNDVRLLVGADKTKTVHYEVVPELCPPGFTAEDAMRHMRAAGWDVRGRAADSIDGNPVIVVAEKY